MHCWINNIIVHSTIYYLPCIYVMIPFHLLYFTSPNLPRLEIYTPKLLRNPCSAAELPKKKTISNAIIQIERAGRSARNSRGVIKSIYIRRPISNPRSAPPKDRETGVVLVSQAGWNWCKKKNWVKVSRMCRKKWSTSGTLRGWYKKLEIFRQVEDTDGKWVDRDKNGTEWSEPEVVMWNLIICHCYEWYIGMSDIYENREYRYKWKISILQWTHWYIDIICDKWNNEVFNKIKG